MLMKDRVAIATGAASLRGIGWATARLFAGHGARVALLDLDAKAAEAAAREIGAGHLGLACDVRDPAACNAAVAENVPLGRLATPLDVANACRYLASDLSAYVTGVVPDVSGGLHIH